MDIDIGMARRAARISQVELAHRTPISRPRLSAAERGYITLMPAELERIRQVIAGEPRRRAEKIKAAMSHAVLTGAETVAPEAR